MYHFFQLIGVLTHQKFLEEQLKCLEKEQVPLLPTHVKQASFYSELP